MEKKFENPLDYIECMMEGADEVKEVRKMLEEKDKEIERLKRNIEIILGQMKKYSSIEDEEIQAIIKAILHAINKTVIEKDGE